MTAVFQFWDRRPPADVARIMRTWDDGEPGFSVVRYNDLSAERYLSRNFGRRAVRAFRSSAPAAMRSDLFRYARLVREGGLYVDCDHIKVRPLAPLLAQAPRGLMMKTAEGRIQNNFIYFAEAGDPLARFLWTAALSNVEQRTSNNVWAVTGPGVATQLYRSEGGPDHPLFAGLTILGVHDPRRADNITIELAYRSTRAHWARRQEHSSIYQRPLPMPVRHLVESAGATLRSARQLR